MLCIGAHPDDIELGCGATIAKHVRMGDTVHVLVMADGVSSRNVPDTEIKKRREECMKAAAILGVESLEMMQFADNEMDKYERLRIVQTVEQSIAKHKPSVVYTHHGSDVNIDHRITNDAVIVACRSQPGHCVKSLSFFEILSSTEWQPMGRVPFQPNLFIEIIDDDWHKKLEAMRCYDSELREYPHPRSIEAMDALSKYRGATIGVRRAEAFVMARGIA